MQRANAGDADAYTRLLGEIGVAMEQYLRRRFGHGEFIEDCVQECLIAIHRARASYDPRRPFRPWMLTIVRHKAIDMLRRSGVRQRHETPERGDDAAGPGAEPGAALEAAQLLSALEPGTRDALVLTKLEGHSVAEAAERLGVSVPAVKSRVHRGIRQIRDLLAREGD